MAKKIFTIGFEIPGKSELEIGFSGSKSVMDSDILLISPDALQPSHYDWVSFSAGGGCYGVESSRKYKQKMSHLRKEIKDHLDQGKNVYILLTSEESYALATGVSSPRKGQTSYNTETHSNYDFMPIDLGIMTSGSGKHIEFSGNPIFSDLYKNFKGSMEYQLYIQKPNDAEVIFTGKDKNKILGAVYETSKGHLITLPVIKYDEEEFTEYNEKEDKNYWNKEGVKFGEKLTKCLLEIDEELTKESEKTRPPEWSEKEEFSTKKALSILKETEKNEKKVDALKSKNEELARELSQEEILKDLLFESGKPLENAVTKALTILGYHAENYDDGILELDHVITSPEKHRFIGECEGKINKEINITKFRQLLESMSADFDRDEVEEKAFGILFGNPQRLVLPSERNLDFTQKCKIGAKREKIALVKTTDLFTVAKYLNENKNEKFKKGCRNAIFKGLGKVVTFPQIPKKQKKV